jgi:hypothetical protein
VIHRRRLEEKRWLDLPKNQSKIAMNPRAIANATKTEAITALAMVQVEHCHRATPRKTA